MSIVEKSSRSIGPQEQGDSVLRVSDMFDFDNVHTLRVKPEVVTRFRTRRGLGDDFTATHVFIETFKNATPITIKPRDLPKYFPKPKGGSSWSFFADPENPSFVYWAGQKGTALSVEGMMNLDARGTRGVTY